MALSSTASANAINALFAALPVLVAVPLFVAVNEVLPAPYMDEIFHVPQALQYCNGNFSGYDPKLTTPPGLYITSYAILSPLSTISGVNLCASVALLRVVNGAFFFGATLIIVRGLLDDVHGRSVRHALDAIVIAAFPVSFFFHFLYYTDSGSTFFVLLAHWLSLKGRYGRSALVGFIATSYRQTNIVWTFFSAALAVLREVSRRETGKDGKIKFVDARISDFPTTASLVRATAEAAFAIMKQLPVVLWTIVPFSVVWLAFGSFVAWNGGIVLGDKANHVATLHIAQILYFIAFAAFFTFPRFPSAARAFNFMRSHAGVTLAFFAIEFVTVQNFTVEHPFLLADNRHYTFYIWKYFFRRSPLIRYALIPGYAAGAYIVTYRLGERQSLIWILGYFLTVFITLIPSPLLEFRYFLVPFFIYRIHVSPPSRTILFLEFIFYFLFNLATFWMFLRRPFEWTQEPGVTQRFMY